MRIDSMGVTSPDPEGPGRKREKDRAGESPKSGDRARISVSALALYEQARETRLSAVRRNIATGVYDKAEVRERVARAMLKDVTG
jgi:hypothetical protein